MKLFPLVLLPIMLAACSEAPPPPAAPKLVRTTIVGAGALCVPGNPLCGQVTADGTQRRYSGEVRARIETTLGFRIAGKIVERRVDAGMAVTAGQVLARLDPSDAGLQATQAEAQRSLAAAELTRYRDLKAKNFISASALDAKETAFKPGQAAEVTFWAAPGASGKPLAGRLREISPVADAATRTYAARVSLPDADPRLPLGMTATVRFLASGASGAPDATRLMVPLTAIFQQGNQAAVWKVGADNTVTLQAVTVAAFTDSGALVVAGLSGGEQIVTGGVNLLSAGEKVRVVTPAATR